jgi:D-sedoheptulose 7-phosphate isomerase
MNDKNIPNGFLNNFIRDYYELLITLLKKVTVSSKSGTKIDFYQGIINTVEHILSQSKLGRKIIFIGNGASQSIASHLAADFLKNAEVKALAFTDPSLLTCISNDLGYECIFEKPIEMFADDGDILVAISSSGQSENIIRGCRAAEKRGCKIITLSGFKPDNQLRSLGDINFYVAAQIYGQVENIHNCICHSIIDCYLEIKQL